MPRAFSALFLWYNILPGPSVPIRRLVIHLFEMKVKADSEAPVTLEDLKIEVRKNAEKVELVRSVGECFVTRVSSGFLVAINIAVDGQMPATEGRRSADRVTEAARGLNPNLQHLFIPVLPDERFF